MLFHSVQNGRRKATWSFWVLMLAVLILPALWKVWFVIGWQVGHPNRGVVQVNAPFPWIQLNTRYPVELVRFNSMSPLWGDSTSSARIAPSSRTDTSATTESWANRYQREYQQKGISILIVKQTPNVACVSTTGSEFVMVCRTQSGMILNYQGDTSLSGEAIAMLLTAAREPNL